jgi:hypothetical protein
MSGEQTSRKAADYTRAKAMATIYETVRQTVFSYMHYSGENREKIDGGQYLSLYLLADGFGKIDANTAIEQCFDWSHIRDSSPTAFYAMFERLSRWEAMGMLQKS